MSNSAIGNREPGADSRGDPRLRPYQFGELRARSPPGAGLIRADVALLLSSRFPELTVTTEGKDRETAARMAAEQLAGQARQLAEDMAGQAERAQGDADTARAGHSQLRSAAAAFLAACEQALDEPAFRLIEGAAAGLRAAAGVASPRRRPGAAAGTPLTAAGGATTIMGRTAATATVTPLRPAWSFRRNHPR